VASIYPVYATITLSGLESTRLGLEKDLKKMQKATKALQSKLADARKQRDKLKKDKNKYN